MSRIEHAPRDLVAGDPVGAVEGGVRQVHIPAGDEVIAELPERTPTDVMARLA